VARYETLSYTVFANGRLEFALTDGSTVEFDVEWMDDRFLPG
jgi:hypothetical protein